jgi:hypothetical protein
MPPPPPPQPLLGHFDVTYLDLPTNETLTLVTMDDRRVGIRVGSSKFLYQGELETIIYRNANSTGAFYRLVSRANAAGNAGAPALVLRGKSVAQRAWSRRRSGHRWSQRRRTPRVCASSPCFPLTRPLRR